MSLDEARLLLRSYFPAVLPYIPDDVTTSESPEMIFMEFQLQRMALTSLMNEAECTDESRRTTQAKIDELEANYNRVCSIHCLLCRMLTPGSQVVSMYGN